MFKAMVSRYKPSIIAVTESWLSDDISGKYTYKDYKQFSSSRRSAHPGGGVLLLFNTAFSVITKSVPIKPPDSCDAVTAIDTVDGHCWVLVYRPPACSADDTAQLCRYLDCLLSEYKSITIMGDFNLRQIRWRVPVENQHLDPPHHRFMEFCTSWYLRQIVPGPTRGGNEIDIILTTHPERYSKVLSRRLSIAIMTL